MLKTTERCSTDSSHAVEGACSVTRSLLRAARIFAKPSASVVDRVSLLNRAARLMMWIACKCQCRAQVQNLKNRQGIIFEFHYALDHALRRLICRSPRFDECVTRRCPSHASANHPSVHAATRFTAMLNPVTYLSLRFIPVTLSTVRKAGAVAGMSVRKEGAATSKSSAEANGVGQNHRQKHMVWAVNKLLVEKSPLG